ncbi:MAG: glutamate-1-semialdehyde 2,1-aminomutase [Thermoguttaceae bacterium]|nr:glutamate-1-semialdehyde 2,1-aminomutase [Thermoguttaceae bacterium]
MNRAKSREIFEKALTLIPGGVNSPARAFGGVGGSPVVFESAKGAYMIDVDGNRYIDYVLSWGPMILGHADPRVCDALRKAVERGTSFGAPTLAENTLAELIIKFVPSVEKVRLVNSGTEATMSAIRLARGYTGRDKIIKFVGCYHGHVDSLLVAAGSAAATLSVPNSPGVTPGCAADTILVEYNDVAAVRETFAQRGSEIAGVIVEPVGGNMGCVPGSREFLQTLRDETKKAGSILIFDEVMSGFRVAKGGAQEYYGITPDVTTLGKVVGGGLPVGAYGGRKEIMDAVTPVGKVYQAGTLSGNPLATAAGIATLAAIDDDPDFYVKLDRTTTRLADGIQRAASDAGVKVAVPHIGGMSTVFFLSEQDDAVVDWPSSSRCDKARFAKFFWNLLDQGVYLPCSQFETMFTSSAHDDAIIDETIDCVARAFKAL